MCFQVNRLTMWAIVPFVTLKTKASFSQNRSSIGVFRIRGPSMARIEVDPNYTSPTFSRATAATDLFKKEDVQNLAAAVSTHDHSTGKGLTIPFATSIPNGTITSAMIADGTIVAGDIADGAITSAKILDGTIATADLANASVTNAKLAADTARANLLTNGGFEIWQRGNGPFTTDSAYLADRWKIYLPVGTMSVSKDTANADIAGACAAVTVGGGPSAGNPQQIYQYPLHTSEIGLQLAGKQITFSARIKTTVANGVRLDVNPSGGTRVYSSYHTGGGTYQTLSVTATIGSAPAGIGVSIAFSFEANGTYYLDNAMLVVGSQAADYAPLHPADDLARCMRYYETTQVAIGEIGASGLVTAGGILRGWYYYKAQKPVAPTVTKVGTWLVANCAQPAASNIGVNGVMLSATGTSANTDTYFLTQAGGAALTVEANP